MTANIIFINSVQFLIYTLFMKKRTKSSVNLHITERLADREVQLEDLKEKIQKSKPILQTIYDKVQRREEMYQQKLSNNQKTISKGRNLANQYKKLYEDNLLVMQKSQLFDSFHNSPSNYLKSRRAKNIQQPKSKSVYEQYKERIGRGRNEEKGENKNPEIANLREESKDLKSKMQKQIEQIRMLRKKSQTSLKKAHSIGYFQTLKRAEATQSGRIVKEMELKERIAQRNREKLSKG